MINVGTGHPSRGIGGDSHFSVTIPRFFRERNPCDEDERAADGRRLQAQPLAANTVTHQPQTRNRETPLLRFEVFDLGFADIVV
jgi:hypothetical protein